MRLLTVVLTSLIAIAPARASVIDYETIGGTGITFEDATFVVEPPGYRRSRDLETFYSPLGVHFFQAFALQWVPGGNTAIYNNQPHPCLVAGLCPPYVQILPPVDSPLAPDHRWRPMWVTFDAPVTEFGFQETPLFSSSSVIIDSMRAYRADVFVGQESFALPPGFGITGLAVSFATPFDLVILDRQFVPAEGPPVFVDGPDGVDNVRFAPAIVGPVPEPAAWLLFAVGGIGVACRARRPGPQQLRGT